MEIKLSAGYKIKRQGWWVNYLPWVRGIAFTIYPSIYLPSSTYADIYSPHPAVMSTATLRHELVHLLRQEEIGIWSFGIRYIFSRQFRLQEELLAVGVQMKYLKSRGQDFDIRDRARRLSSGEYLWCTNYQIAVYLLQRMWATVEVTGE